MYGTVEWERTGMTLNLNHENRTTYDPASSLSRGTVDWVFFYSHEPAAGSSLLGAVAFILTEE